MRRKLVHSLRVGVILSALLLTISCNDSSPTSSGDGNQAPNTPAIDASAGAPADGATDVDLSAALHWTCTDPDGDDLTFAVQFGTVNSPPEVSSDQTAASYSPAGMTHATTYYWRVTAEDPEAETTASAVWSFTTVAAPGETVGAPGTPTGPALGETGETLSFTAAGATSSEGHLVEYRFDWGDLELSDWTPTMPMGHAWTSVGDFDVRAQARCQNDPAVVSTWSAPLTVSVEAPETISTPDAPAGPASGEVNVPLSYYIAGAASNHGHVLDIRFDWGNGSISDWIAAAGEYVTYTEEGDYEIRVQARCHDHQSVISAWSIATTVTVTAPAETVHTPNAPTSEWAAGSIGLEVPIGVYAPSYQGHPVEARFDWGDGSVGDWVLAYGGSVSDSHTWTVGGTYEIRAQARCIEHPEIVSPWSDPFSFEILDVEVVSVPVLTPDTEMTVVVNEWGTIRADAEGNLGHGVEFMIDFGDDSTLFWTTGYWTSIETYHKWTEVGDYTLQVKARCYDHHEIESDWSIPITVHVIPAP